MRTEQEVTRAIEQYSDMVLRLCTVYMKNRSDAEDIFQTVFLKYTLSPRQFQSAEHEKAWLIRVTINACKDLLKSFHHRQVLSLEELNEEPSCVTPEQYRVIEAVWSLPETYRNVVYLHYYEGYTAPEIGNILNKNTNTVYTQLRKAKELLAQSLGGDFHEG